MTTEQTKTREEKEKELFDLTIKILDDEMHFRQQLTNKLPRCNFTVIKQNYRKITIEIVTEDYINDVDLRRLVDTGIIFEIKKVQKKRTTIEFLIL